MLTLSALKDSRMGRLRGVFFGLVIVGLTAGFPLDAFYRCPYRLLG